MEKIYEVYVCTTEVRLERVSAKDVEHLKERIKRRGWEIAPCSVPREIPSYPVRP